MGLREETFLNKNALDTIGPVSCRDVWGGIRGSQGEKTELLWTQVGIWTFCLMRCLLHEERQERQCGSLYNSPGAGWQGSLF